MGRRIIRRRKASEDIDAALDFYIRGAGAEVAVRFVDDLAATLNRVSQHPEIGSLRFEYEFGFVGVRSLFLDTFPYTLLYKETRARIEVIRVLNSRRDIIGELDADDEL